MGDPVRSVGSAVRREFVASHAGRIDAVLSAVDDELTRARVQKLIAEGLVELNGAVVRKSARVEAGDRVAYAIPGTPHEARPVDFDLPVLFEDDVVVAIDKPAGLNVHPAPGDDSATVADWFLEHFAVDGAAFLVDHPGIVHRLDRDTSGVMLLARTPAAQAFFSAAFEQRDVHKTYVAITAAVPPRDRALIDAAIGRHPGDRTRMAVTRGGREARTGYRVVGTERDNSIVVVTPETGRTHQIRVHLAAVGAPVLFDQVYGKGGEGRQMLHAWQIDVPHPGGGRLEVTAPLPADMLATVRSIGLEHVASTFIEARPARRFQE
jgi:23S rRNA pseudouridine1911/1915/1917 synthase